MVFEKFMVHAPLSKFLYQKANLEAQICHLYGPTPYLNKISTLSAFYCLGFRNEKLFHFLTLSDVKLVEIYIFDFSLNFVFVFVLLFVFELMLIQFIFFFSKHFLNYKLSVVLDFCVSELLLFAP